MKTRTTAMWVISIGSLVCGGIYVATGAIWFLGMQAGLLAGLVVFTLMSVFTGDIHDDYAGED